MTNPCSWYKDIRTDENQILSSRVRLARNIKKYPFNKKLTAAIAENMIKEAVDSVINDRSAVKDMFLNLNLHELGQAEQKVFLEKHIVSPEFIKNELPKGLLLTDDTNTGIMINEEDHIRIQTVTPGDSLAEAFDMANHIDDLIEESLEYAFHSEYGYLAACPTNTGTGLRASYMIHLPALEKSGQLKNILPNLSQFGITLRGIYGEGTESMGCIYQISNQTTLGKSERDIIQSLQSITYKVIEQENLLKDNMLNQNKADMENNIYRAYGILAYSRKISAKEAMELLSEIRLGYLTGLLKKERPEKRIYQIMMEIQPGHLQRAAGQELSEHERDTARAEYLRGIFK